MVTEGGMLLLSAGKVDNLEVALHQRCRQRYHHLHCQHHPINHILHILTINTKFAIINILVLQGGKQKISDALDSGSALEKYVIYNIWRYLLKTSPIYGEKKNLQYLMPQVPNDVDWARSSGDLNSLTKY